MSQTSDKELQTQTRVQHQLWSIILAGGDGQRTRPFIQRWLGRPRPKQYCAFVGTRSMLQHTLDRAAQLSARERRVTVIASAHERDAREQLGGKSPGIVALQPQNRDTAAGVLLPLTHVRARNPDATVVIYPSDHFVFPEEQFVDVVRSAVRVAEQLENRLVLLGVAPDRAERDYGWIHRGGHLETVDGYRVHAVRSFIEKPGPGDARAAMASGGLWNTLVVAAKLNTIWRLARDFLPEIVAQFERLSDAMGTAREAAVLDSIYRRLPNRNFSSDLLARATDHLVAIELAGVLWSDWGKPERILESLGRIDKRPAFPSECLVA